ncbi:nonribosomal siderophore peptide synthase Sid2 [Microthyrium microscopicum]|uniref:Nonribosomal siderophore peptide synthase Sid2 n=1 Tax=Microthyrium microscopicum TaxID=703497 RepID=A0A6A6U471_9PEZI|nr:nonribosomal siderophore peptide synthase Sid2 [Microthyrium microscopicum]
MTDILQVQFTTQSGFQPFKVDYKLDSGLKDHPACSSDFEHLLLLSWILTVYRYHGDAIPALGWGQGHIENQGHPDNILSRAFIQENLLQDRDIALDRFTNSIRDQLSSTNLSIGTTHRKIRTLSFIDGSLLAAGLEPDDSEAQIRIDCFILEGYLWARSSWNPKSRDEFSANCHIRSLAHILNLLIANQNISIKEATKVQDWELSQLWTWNHRLPANISQCSHELISSQANVSPNALAIDAWDGKFTYTQVQTYSTQLAYMILKLRIKQGAAIPICFSKSRWTVIAVLAVMKAGFTFVLMDPSQPKARLATIAEQVSATTMITSKSLSQLGKDILPDAHVFALSETFFSTEQIVTAGESITTLPNVSPSSILYIIFTSGSTGKPKGVVISHETYTSGAIPRCQTVGYKSDTRVLDFASYAFDVSIDSMLCTLMQGGCLCIPSDEDRLNNLNGLIRNMSITMANLTPSIARILDDDVISQLHSLGLGGEAVSPRDVSLWGKSTRIVIGYGPSECTVGCTINSSADTGKDYVNIGQPTGACLWLADPDDAELLVPIGAVGELLVEGPVVGQGYLNDPEKTAASFIPPPIWLHNSDQSADPRPGPLYRTGDLVRYDPDGSGALIFVGRKDTQVKIRGQRVELGEVEHHIRQYLGPGFDIVAEVVKKNDNSQPALVAFVALSEARTSEPLKIISRPSGFATRAEGLQSHLSHTLPRYMVPSEYILVNLLPLMVSRKIDRKTLRSLIAPRETANGTLANGKSETGIPEEELMRVLWSTVLGVSPTTLNVDSNFFSMGGDSISAMKLVSAARSKGYLLSVAEILASPVLTDMSHKMQSVDDINSTNIPAFSLIPSTWDVGEARTEAAKLCDIDVSEVEDIYPCSPLQEQLIAFSVRSEESFIAQRIFKLPSPSTVEKFIQAWDAVFRDVSALRTRVAQFESHGLMQIVTEGTIIWHRGTDLQNYLEEDHKTKRALGDRLCSFAAISNSHQEYTIVWTIHHSIYDGWSTPLIIDRLKSVYQGLTLPMRPSFKSFIQHISKPSAVQSKNYWLAELTGASGRQFPALPSRNYIPRPDVRLKKTFILQPSSESTISTATILRGAWALISSQLTGADSVIIGETLTGRSISIPEPGEIEGPMITTVPVKISVDPAISCSHYLHNIHTEAITRIPHEHTGLQYIRRLSSDLQLACEIKTGFVIQPFEPASDDEIIPSSNIFLAKGGDPAEEAIEFNSYPLMIACALRSTDIVVHASFDSGLISVKSMERILDKFEIATQQLLGSHDSLIHDVSLMSHADLSQIWSWNAIPPARLDEATNDIVVSTLNSKEESRLSKVVVPWITHLSDNEKLAPIGFVGELHLEGPIKSTNTIQDPSWLIKGHGAISGRSGRLSKTGALARYDNDGSIIIINQGRSIEKAVAQEPDDDQRMHMNEKSTSQAPESEKEAVLRRAWQKVLRLESKDFKPNDSFFQIGGDSIIAMKLVSIVRASGYSLSVADIFRRMHFREMALGLTSLSSEEELPKAKIIPFSLLKLSNSTKFAETKILSLLENHNWDIADALPVSDTQDMDINATIRRPRSSVQYNIFYFDHSIDLARLAKACDDLVDHYEILRTVFVKNEGSYLQVVLQNLEAPREKHETKEDVANYCNKLCKADIESEFALGSSFLRFFFIRGPSKQALVFRISHAQYDGVSLSELVRHINTTYGGAILPQSIPFSRYMHYINGESKQAAQSYWKQKLNGSQMTVLDKLGGSSAAAGTVFLTKACSVPSNPGNFTLATILTVAWAIVLARSQGLHDVVFGAVVNGRSVPLPEIEQVAGPCYGIVPVRVELKNLKSHSSLLLAVQQSRVDDLQHEIIGLKSIRNLCPEWSQDTDFSSIVHHQEVDYFDTMALGDTTAQVDYQIPHSEKPNPWKIVSYVEAGKVVLGIQGEQACSEFVDSKLNELVNVVEMLVYAPETSFRL